MSGGRLLEFLVYAVAVLIECKILESNVASLFVRANKVFYVVFSDRGKRVWRSLGTRNEEEAQRKYEQIKMDRQKEGPVTLMRFADRFLQAAALSLSQKTVLMYKASFRNLARICGDKILARVSPSDPEEFKSTRAKEVAPTSVNIELRTLKSAFNEALRLKLIRENPFLNTRLVRVPYKEAGFISESDFERLLEIIADPLLKDIVDFAANTMMRLGEIMDLKWCNVDCEHRVIHVVHSDDLRVKGGKPRSVPMALPVLEILHRRSRASQYVFCNVRGCKLDGNNISRRFKRCVRKAGLSEGIHFHSLRHTGISWLINRGVPPQFVQRIAGHSSLAVTSIYSHVQDQNLIDAISVLRRHEVNGVVSSSVSRN